MSQQFKEVSPPYLNEAVVDAVPVGYKKTEVGIIPEDWDVEKIGNLVAITTGNKNTQDRVQGGLYPFFVRSEQVERINSFSFDGEAVLTAGDGVGTGKVIHYINGKFDFHQRVYLIHNFGKKLNGYYFFIFFSNRFYDRIMSMTAKSSVDSVRREMISEMLIAIPTEKEQTAIATVLSDIDALISEQEKLIAKKQAIKTATMQQLLTGRTRLPQFALREDGYPKGYKSSELGEIPEDWGVFAMNDVVDICSSGATPYRGNKDFYKGTNRWITSGELNYCTINDTIEKISDEAVLKTNLKIHPAGTFLMAITGLEAAGTRGACGIVGKPSTTNQSCMAIYPNNKLVTPYLYYWYIYNGENLAFKYCQGTKQLSYTAGLVRKIPIYLPTEIKEQTAIAAILSGMDEEIQALEQRLTKTRQIKQGMMQELLTGKTRLVKPL